MPDVHVTVWDETGGTGEPVVFVHGSTSWGTDPVLGFGAQRPLARHHRLLMMDRRGYGHSPDIEHGDYTVDAGDLIEVIEASGGRAHLVGHSYGGVVVMLAAARRPEAVASLVLIEPGCYQVAADDPVVARALAANRSAHAAFPRDIDPAEYLAAAAESVGMPAMEPTSDRLRATRTALHERPCWEAEIPVAPLAALGRPKLVMCGSWETAPPLYRERGGEPIMACARVTARRIGASLLTVRGTGHYCHVERPDVVNDALRATFEPRLS